MNLTLQWDGDDLVEKCACISVFLASPLTDCQKMDLVCISGCKLRMSSTSEAAVDTVAGSGCVMSNQYPVRLRFHE